MIWYYVIIVYKCRPCPAFDELYPGIFFTTEEKHGKTSVRVSQYTIKKPQSHITIQNITIHITISKTTHYTVYCNQKP